MTEIRIPFPLGGINENLSFTDQNPNTTREAQNVRAKDPKTGRLRGAQRAGMGEYLDDNAINGANKVDDLNYVTKNQSNITYANAAHVDNPSTPATVDDIQGMDVNFGTPSEGDSTRLRLDRQGNVYVLDGTEDIDQTTGAIPSGSGIAKFNPEGDEIWRLDLPVDDPKHNVLGLHVDAVDNVYASVGEGGPQETCRIWKYLQKPDNEFELLWQLEVDAYVPDLVTKGNVLWTIQNSTSTGESHLVAYDLIDTTLPEEIQRTKIPHPSNALAFSTTGSLIVASPRNADRGENPNYPEGDPIAVGWTPNDLDTQEQLFAWFDANSVDGQGNASLAQGDQILQWTDLTGNERHLYAATDLLDLLGVSSVLETEGGSGITTITGPSFDLQSLNGLPGVLFNGTSSLMRSLGNAATDYGFRDQQKSMLPAYEEGPTTDTGAMYALFMVIRTTDDQLDRFVVGQETAQVFLSHENAVGGATNRYIFANRQADPVNSDITAADQGFISAYEDSTGTNYAPHGPSNYPDHENQDGITSGPSPDAGGTATGDGTITNKNNVAIITLIVDGGVEGEPSGGDADTPTRTRSTLRYNGVPIDRWESETCESVDPVYIGGTGISDADFGTDMGTLANGRIARLFLGHAHEIIVLDRRDISNPTTEPKVVTHDAFGNKDNGDHGAGVRDLAYATQTDNDVTRFEGHLANKWGVRDLLPGSDTEYPHPYAAAAPTTDETVNVNDLNDTNQVLMAIDPNSGEILWSETDLSGTGYAVAAGTDGQLFCAGERDNAGTQVRARKVIDTGTAATTTNGTTWVDDLGLASTAELSFPYLTVAVDAEDNAYFPIVDTAASTDIPCVRAIEGDSTATDSNLPTVIWDWAVLPNSPSGEPGIFAVAVPPTVPRDVTRAEHMWLSANGNTFGFDESVWKIINVTKTLNQNDTRTTTLLGLVGGNLYKLTGAGASAVTTGGTGVSATSPHYVQSVAAYEKVFYTDGLNYFYYDVVEDETLTWRSTSAGLLPPRTRLVELWRGRMVLARGEEPQNWYMSEQGDPFNWDFFPPVVLATSAVAGNDSRLGLVPDIVQTMIPYNDDLLIFGCDHSIHRMTGDPQSGGQFDLVTDKMGMAFGRPWTKDREGRIYFFMNAGGVAVMSPNGQIQRITRDSIEKRMRSIDFTTHYVKLEWNYKDEGLHVFVMPFGGTTTSIVQHWFWEQQLDSWWEDELAATTIQPTAITSLDSDTPADRALLLGCEDGHVRDWDTEADDDDGLAIDSHVLMGPIGASDTNKELRFNKWHSVIADDQSGVNCQLFVSNEPDVLGNSRGSTYLRPGLNPILYKRIRGAYGWLRYRNAFSGQRWAHESTVVDVTEAGRRRVRIRS